MNYITDTLAQLRQMKLRKVRILNNLTLTGYLSRTHLWCNCCIRRYDLERAQACTLD